MTVRFAAAFLLALAAPLAAQAPAPAPAPAGGTVKVQLTTSAGPILLELEAAKAPVTTANFLHYVDTKRYDGEAIYRSVKVQPGYGLIQGGVRGDARKLFPPIKHEPTTQTGLSHVEGTISMARLAPGTARSDFFITIGALTTMDADPKAPGDNLGFAAFGHVAQGMDVVKAILDMPTDPNAGEGAMKGQILAMPVKIITARRVN